MKTEGTVHRRMKSGGEYWHEDVTDILRDRIVSLDFAEFILGDLLGRGISRMVFDYKPDPKLVIKIELNGKNQNLMEYEIWRQIQYYEKMNKWFAPIIDISRCGRILLQKKANMERDWDEYPTHMPEFFTDIKTENYGFIGKQCVCVDYGFVKMLEFNDRARMKKVKWY